MIDRFSNGETLSEALLSQKLVRGDISLGRELAESGELCVVGAGEVLITQGDSDNHVFFLLAGKYEVVVNGRVLATRGPGEHVGEMAAITPSLRRSATVRACEPGVVSKITAARMVELANRYPSMWHQLAKVLAERLDQRNRFVTATRDRVRVFVISSVEGLPIAHAVQESFAHDPFDVVVWDNGIFRASEYAIESLTNVLDVSDFAVAIAQPDDLVEARGSRAAVPRDNVLFELGLFIGRLGRLRSFLLEPAETGVKLPSDLSGITVLHYRPGPEPALLSLLGPACNHLRRLFKEIGPNN